MASTPRVGALDPATLIPIDVGGSRVPAPGWPPLQRIFEAETLESPRYAVLRPARVVEPVNRVSAAAGGDLERSVYYRYVLAPIGVEHELRAGSPYTVQDHINRSSRQSESAAATTS